MSEEALIKLIMEKISEKQKAWGRPRVMAINRAILEIEGVGTDYRSERQRINRAYALNAIQRLGGGEDPAFFWLVNYVEQDRRPHNVFAKREQWTILGELGRMAEDDALRAVAARICELQPTTRDAVAMIRRWRLGTGSPADVEQLTKELCQTLNHYLRRHPDLTWTQARQALTSLAAAIQETEDADVHGRRWGS